MAGTDALDRKQHEALCDLFAEPPSALRNYIANLNGATLIGGELCLAAATVSSAERSVAGVIDRGGRRYEFSIGGE
jgi:hypothetical protein